ncbi:MAG: response regulator transcription factor [Proteobacteria bacterium]|nr:response regulator transcription factor [Pseudomonadota bacterium]
MKVLAAEDDHHMLAAIVDILEGEGYQVVAARDGRQALALFRSENPDFVCLDIMMPHASGYDVCREIRQLDATVPVVFLSAKTEEIDKVLGLELGADDYIMKPFGIKEFVARVRAISRRCFAVRPEPERDRDFTMGEIAVMPGQLRARRADGHVVELSLREIKILATLHANQGKALSRDHLFRTCWGGDHYPNSRTLDQHISQLRKKIELDVSTPAVITTVRGVGYRFDP